MKNIVRALDYYGYEDDATMYKNDGSNKIFAISKVKEQKNKKYMRKSEEDN